MIEKVNTTNALPVRAEKKGPLRPVPGGTMERGWSS
jgi:hypothetical protein